MVVAKASYGCAQKDLYSGLRIVWKSFKEDVDAFKSYKGKYILTMADDALIAIDGAEAMPDSESRVAAGETIRVDLKKLAGLVIDDFVKTEGYIDDLFPEADKQKPQYVIAGYNYFVGAENSDWESVKQLGTKNLAYVTDNSVALEMGGANMPPVFPNTVKDNLIDYEIKYSEYMTARESGVDTSEKLKADNACYASGKGMMKDGVNSVFRGNAAKADNYNWDRIQAMINSAEAGMDGYVKEKVTSASLVDAVITMKMDGKEAKTVKSVEGGKYVLKGIEAGTYTYSVVMAGYKTITGTIIITVRNVSRMNFEMEVG